MKPFIILILVFSILFTLAFMYDKSVDKKLEDSGFYEHGRSSKYDQLRYGKDKDGRFILYNINGDIIFKEKE